MAQRLDMVQAIEIAVHEYRRLSAIDEPTTAETNLLNALATLILHSQESTTNALINMSVDAQRQTDILIARIIKGSKS